MDELMCKTNYLKRVKSDQSAVAPGWLIWLGIFFLILTQVMVLGLWDPS